MIITFFVVRMKSGINKKAVKKKINKILGKVTH